jgi:hypothetical protein
MDTFFNTFSTIAETLAGAIALLAAFLLYKLQSLDTEINNISELLANWVDMVSGPTPESQNAKALHLQGHYRELLTRAEQTTTPTNENWYQSEVERKRLHVLLCYKPALLWRFHIALYLTGGLIMVSILAVIQTPYLAASCWASWILDGAAFWFVGCILSYVMLILKVFEERKPA